MFMGEIMKRSKGKADPKLTNQLLAKRLAEVSGK
jgi:Asp-tRNA(Asn)/Glu-tRNA(Gln) amidotransferase B subunit